MDKKLVFFVRIILYKEKSAKYFSHAIEKKAKKTTIEKNKRNIYSEPCVNNTSSLDKTKSLEEQ